MLIKSGCEIGTDPGCDELLKAVLLRLLQYSLDRVLLDPELVDLVLIEQRLELAIGNRRVLLAGLVETLEKRKHDESNHEVPNIDLSLAIHTALPFGDLLSVPGYSKEILDNEVSGSSKKL